MKLIKIKELFKPVYGINLELNKLKLTDQFDKDGVLFVSRTSKNNGVSAIVKKIPKLKPNPAHTISIAGGGSVLEAFYQSKEYYSGRDLYYLLPKEELSECEMIFYCYCITKNKFKYSYGRQANRTLGDILIPAKNQIPKWVYVKFSDYVLNNECAKIKKPIDYSENQIVKLTDLFYFYNGLSSSEVKRHKSKINDDFVPYIRPSNSQATSIDAYVKKDGIKNKYIFPEGTLYVSTDGQGSHSYSYISTFQFVPNSNVTVLIPKRDMELQEKLFYSMMITKNRYKYSYGRKPKGNRLKILEVPKYPPEWFYNQNHFDKII